MSKYIIKNCPCFLQNEKCNIWANSDELCSENPNCTMKHIVNLCKISNKYSQKQYKEDDLTAKHILQLLDIQEVE